MSVPRAVLLLIAAAATAPTLASRARAQTTEAIQQRTEGGWTRWDWSGSAPDESIVASFVRADVRIERSRGDRVEVHVVEADPNGNGSAVTMMAVRDHRGLRIIDRYPSSLQLSMAECPPARWGAWRHLAL